jgi:hemerythrin
MVAWKPEYSVEVRKLDNQHRKILDVLNKMSTLQRGDEREKMKEVFAELLSYIETHFSMEEELMKRHNFPGLEAQKKAHDAFIDKVCDALKDFLKNRNLVAINVFNFVWDWFAGHIVRMDKEYTPYMKAKKPA